MRDKKQLFSKHILSLAVVAMDSVSGSEVVQKDEKITNPKCF